MAGLEPRSQPGPFEDCPADFSWPNLVHPKKLAAAPKAGDNRGLFFVGAGVLLFVLAARCLQPRLALGALPFLIYGSVLYLWGKPTARIILFPCVFLIFLIPFGAVEQATFRLQFVITAAIGTLCKLVGLHVDAIGTTLTASDNRFNFMIAEGCSGDPISDGHGNADRGLRSHQPGPALEKNRDLRIFRSVCARRQRRGRIFTIVLVARFISPKFAEGLYHDYSDWLFFPIALLAMYFFSRFINSGVFAKRVDTVNAHAS